MSTPDVICVFRRCNQEGIFHTVWSGSVCESHSNLIWCLVEQRDAANRAEPVQGREGRDYIRVESRAKSSVDRRKPQALGEIYFVRVNDLIKVGWTTKLADRIRAYGPTAELLANYPGTRADEAALHRQLTPARFRGREWYSDVDIIRGFVAEAINRHGPPRFERLPWTEHKGATKPKRWSA